MKVVPKTWFCTQCSMQYKFLNLDFSFVYRLHLKLVHNKAFDTKSLKNALKTNEKPKSGNKFGVKSDLNKQMKTIGVEEKIFKCDICNLTFSQKDKINHHVYNVHKGNKAFQCETCEKSFSQKINLKTHSLSVHEKKKPNKCEYCDHKFSLKGDLDKHISSVHEGIKPFKCDLCLKNFSRKSSLNNHIASNHMMKNSSNMNLPTPFIHQDTIQGQKNLDHEGAHLGTHFLSLQ